MTVYDVEGTFCIRSGLPEEWAKSNIVLLKGEMGWEVGTPNFKIGDGVHSYRDLQYIKPVPSSTPYSLRLGTREASYSYDELKTILDSISQGDMSDLVKRVDQLEVVVKEGENIFVDYPEQLPTIGKQGPIYIVRSTGNSYYFNIDQIEDKPIGYVLLNPAPKVYICGLN